MNQALQQETIPGEIKKPLRIMLFLTTRQGDIGSLDPFCKALLGPAMFEAAKRQRSQGKGFIALSDQRDLSIIFPPLESSRIVATSVMMVAAAAGLIFLPLNTRLLWLVVVWAIIALAKTLKSLFTATEITVRGDLPDVIAESNALALWLSGGRGRKARLEAGETTRVQAEARKPEEIQPMFQVAIEAQG